MFERCVDAWAAAIEQAVDLPPDYPVRDAARVSQCILYGLFNHSYLAADAPPDLDLLRQRANTAISGYLNALRCAA